MIAGDWRKIGIHVAVWLFGTALSVLLAMPMLFALAQVPGLPMLLDPVLGGPGDFKLAAAIWLGSTWIVGLAVTYALVALGFRPSGKKIRS
jgi:hypothetical protein